MNKGEFIPIVNMVSMISKNNTKAKVNFRSTAKLSASESNNIYGKVISYKNRKEDKQYKRI